MNNELMPSAPTTNERSLTSQDKRASLDTKKLIDCTRAEIALELTKVCQLLGITTPESLQNMDMITSEVQKNYPRHGIGEVYTAFVEASKHGIHFQRKLSFLSISQVLQHWNSERMRLKPNAHQSYTSVDPVKAKKEFEEFAYKAIAEQRERGEEWTETFKISGHVIFDFYNKTGRLEYTDKQWFEWRERGNSNAKKENGAFQELSDKLTPGGAQPLDLKITKRLALLYSKFN